MDKKTYVWKSPCFYFLIFFSIVRIILSNWVGIWFQASQFYDDALMVNYADLIQHFQVPSINSLLKYLGYPVFLHFVSKTPFTYATCTAILWIMAATCIFVLSYKLTYKKWFSTLAFIYVLYMPMAFETWMGTRLYRNAIIVPSCCISLSLMILTVLYLRQNPRKIRKCVLLSVFSGIAFTFTYYIKEDGIWLLACLLFATLIGILLFLINFINKKQHMVKSVITMMILLGVPLAIFQGTTQIYKMVDKQAFGVAELNTRTEGELGNFVKHIYKIESDNRTGDIWAPYDAIVQAYNASATFQKYPELFTSILTTPWYSGDIETNPIRGDFLTWVLRTALNDNGLWENEKQISDLFSQINSELDQSFEQGTLPSQTGRIQLLSSAGGRSIEEIFDLHTLIENAFTGTIFLNGYTPGVQMIQEDEFEQNIPVYEQAAKFTNTEYIANFSSRSVNLDSVNRFCKGIFWVYRVVNISLCGLLIVIICEEVLRFVLNFKNMKDYIRDNTSVLLDVCMALLSIGIGVIYSFSIAWFCSFLFEDGVVMEILNFYNIALPIFMMFAYLFAVIVLIKRFPKFSLKSSY